MPEKIPLFVEGDSRTPLSAEVMNQILQAINPWQNVVGVNGIRVTRSDSNVTIALDFDLSSSISTAGDNTPTTSSNSTGSIQWKRQWSAGREYKTNDIVRRTLDAEYNAGNVVGTYIAIRDCPLGCPEPSMVDNAYWEVFAPFACNHLVMVNSGSEAKVTLTSRTNPRLLLQENFSVSAGNGSVDIDVADARHKAVSLSPLNTCEEGVAGQRIFLESDAI